MFKNIGKKIKVLAMIYAIIGIVASVLGGGFSMLTGIMGLEWGGFGYLLIMFIFGLLIMIVGSLISWISAWPLYGFGELIDKTADTANNTAILAQQASGYNNAPAPEYNMGF